MRGVGIQRPELDHVVDPQPVGRRVVVATGDEHHREVHDDVREPLELAHHAVGGLLDGLDDEQRRLRRHARESDRGSRACGRVAVRVQDRAARAMRVHRELGDEPCLPHPWTAGERERRAGAVARGPPAIAEARELAVTPDERWRAVDLELARQRATRRPGRARELRVLTQDRVVQLAQLLARLDAELADEHRSCATIGLEGLGLSPAAIQREHELRGEALARGMCGHQALELADERRVLSGGEIGIDAQLERREPLLLQARDLRGGERHRRQVPERRTLPQRERLAQRGGRELVLSARQRAAPLLDEVLEAGGIELVGAHAQAVAGRRRLDDIRVVQRLADARHVHLDRLDRAWRSIGAPERAGQPLRAHRFVGVQQQDGQDGSGFAAPERDRRPAAVADL